MSPTVHKFFFLHILTNTCYLLSFWWKPLWHVWDSISLWFWFAFLWWLVIFLCLLVVCMSSLEKCLFKSLPNLKLTALLMLTCMSSFHILSIIRYIICKYLLPFSRLPFCFVDSLLCCAKAFLFGVVSFVYFCFCFSCLRKHIQKGISKIDVKKHTVCIFFFLTALLNIIVVK